MRARKRRTRYTWLPADGQNIEVGPTTINSVYFTVTNSINVGAGSALPSTVFSNVLDDFPETDFDVSTVSLADAIGSEYFLKRLVGKCFQRLDWIVDSGADLTDTRSFPDIISTIGFFIAQADPANISLPFGSNADFQGYNPGNVIAIREPWIWRRSWVYSPNFPLHNAAGASLPANINEVGAGTNGPYQISGYFPSNNANYGSVADGPHIDAKTARRVGKHERLWVAHNMQLLPEGATFVAPLDQASITTYFDLRALGALRRAKNRSNFT